jgi:hypothetical protein
MKNIIYTNRTKSSDINTNTQRNENPRNLLKKQGTSALDAGWDFMTSNGASLRRHKAK